jgi:hypothetical protein
MPRARSGRVRGRSGWRVGTARTAPDAGMVTAEAALALPALAFVAVALAWLLTLGVTQVVLAQAVREGARAAARGDSPAEVRQTVRDLAPGAVVRIGRRGGVVRVRASVRAEPPIGLLRPLGREVSATASAWWEQP